MNKLSLADIIALINCTTLCEDVKEVYRKRAFHSADKTNNAYIVSGCDIREATYEAALAKAILLAENQKTAVITVSLVVAELVPKLSHELHEYDNTFN